MHRSYRIGSSLVAMVAVGLALFAAPVFAQPPAPLDSPQALLQVQMTGLDVIYDGSAIYDARASNDLGVGDPADADPLTRVSFYEVGGSTLGFQFSNIWADFRIEGVTNIPLSGGSVFSTGAYPSFGCDLLIKNEVPGWGLALRFTSPVEVVFDSSRVVFSGSATILNIFDQDLPYGLVMDTPVQLTFTTAVLEPADISDDGVYISSFAASGTADAIGPMYSVPVAPVTWSRVKTLYLPRD